MYTDDKPMSPCKECTERHEACWDNCQSYQKWHETMRELSRQEYQNKVQKRLEYGGASWKLKNLH